MVNKGNTQTNTFPASGNVGIGISNPSGKLHINGPMDGSVPALRIGPSDPGNIHVPSGASTGGYNIDFHTWRDLVPEQIGARIRAERVNNYFGNNALIQSMDLSFYTSDGMDQSRLTEKLRIKSNGDVGIGTFDPQHKLHVEGSIGGTLLTIRNPNTWQSGLNVYNNLGNGFQFNVGGSTNQAIGAGHLGIYGSESNQYLLAILSSGNVGIGTTTPTEKLSVNGRIRAKEIKVDNLNWPDYVFEKTYDLQPLTEVEHFIKEKKHLPGVPSAKEVQEEGVALGEMNAILLRKIEELTLYVIALKKENEKIQEENRRQKLAIEQILKK